MNVGCGASDYVGAPANSIIVILRGNCTFQEKAMNAIAANASAGKTNKQE